MGLQLEAVTFAFFRKRFHSRQCPLKIADCLHVGELPQGPLPGLSPVTSSFVEMTAFIEMTGDELEGRIVLWCFREHGCDTLMAPLAVALQERLIRGIAYQRVLEFET